MPRPTRRPSARGSNVDFDDLELFARDLLAGDAALRARYSERFARIMVDEFQDTNPLQLELLDLLGTGRTFYVGDAQQSIYRFRHASVELFADLGDELAAAGQAEQLATNFRTRGRDPGGDQRRLRRDGPLRAARRRARGRAGRSAAGRAAADRLRRLGCGRRSARCPPAAPTAAPRRGLSPSACATSSTAAKRKAGDVCVLLRASTDMETFERALEDQGFATLASGGRGFWARQQVLDLTSYLAALVNPRDEEALLAVLASPIVGAGSDTLALLGPGGEGSRRAALGRPRNDRVPGRRAPGASSTPGFAQERALAPRLSLDELLERVIERTRYDEHVLRLPGGRRRMANVTKLIRLAAAFEARAGRDARGFIDRARAELEADAREPDAPVELEGLDAVRLMTIHAAKGLEFGVVVLADLGRQTPGGGDAIRLGDGRIGLRLRRLGVPAEDAFDYAALGELDKQADRLEDERVFYVACTRAPRAADPQRHGPARQVAQRLDADQPARAALRRSRQRGRAPSSCRSCTRARATSAPCCARPCRRARPARRSAADEAAPDIAELPAPPAAAGGPVAQLLGVVGLRRLPLPLLPPARAAAPARARARARSSGRPGRAGPHGARLDRAPAARAARPLAPRGPRRGGGASSPRR